MKRKLPPSPSLEPISSLSSTNPHQRPRTATSSRSLFDRLAPNLVDQNNPNRRPFSAGSSRPNRPSSAMSKAPKGAGGGGPGGKRSTAKPPKKQGGPPVTGTNDVHPLPNGNSPSKKKKSSTSNPNETGPLCDQDYIFSCWSGMGCKGQIPKKYLDNPKAVLSNYLKALTGETPKFEVKRVTVQGTAVYRAKVVADPEPPPPPQAYGAPSLPQSVEPLIGTGDASAIKQAEKLAALHSCIQLYARGLFTSSNLPTRTIGPAYLAANNSGNAVAGPSNPIAAPPASLKVVKGKSIELMSGPIIAVEEARIFVEHYCQRFGFKSPALSVEEVRGNFVPKRKGGTKQKVWVARLLIDHKEMGNGTAQGKKDAQHLAYLDTARYLDEMDPSLWNEWTERKRSNAISKGQIPAHVVFKTDRATAEELNETVYEARDSSLYKRAQKMLDREEEKRWEEDRRRRLRADGMDVDEDAEVDADGTNGHNARRRADRREPMLKAKSDELKARLRAYQTDERVEKMREQRASLPISSNASTVLAKIATSPVTVVLAATGSGKTTQIPQLILDDWILRGDGAKCNIVCTQPRRIAAISVAERVAKERGEHVGDSVGYQVRFEAKTPKPDGSILFCTTGLFLRRLQTDLNENGTFLDGVTHVLVDEAHERDVSLDLLLFVLRMLLKQRREAGKAEIKIVLMSATIDPKLFTAYFADDNTGRLAPTVDIPGRSFPVEQHWLDDAIQELRGLNLHLREGGWVWSEKSVQDYLQRELVQRINVDHRTGRPEGEIDALDMPYPLIALLIANAIAQSDDGHVLVFLPGWDEIKAVHNLLLDRSRNMLGIDFTDNRLYEIHVLHSTVPIAEQQAVFEPPREGVRRIVLSTNIAETSVTIPDIVYVVDSAKCKEKRYDPERRLSQLISAWTGTSNLFQRAGRAGRHREGIYYSLVSNARREVMDIHQTVEMRRIDIANVVMTITGLELRGLTVEDVLSQVIQPPERERIFAALDSLHHVGAIDRHEKLTSLGRVLLQLPVEAAIGKLCLLGSFFRCLEPALTLAAILTNRDPFMSPIAVKEQADLCKNAFTPTDFRSDPLTILQAYNQWESLLTSRGGVNRAHSFTRDNYLSYPTLTLIQKIKQHLLQSLDKAGVLGISAGGSAVHAPSGRNLRRGHNSVVPQQLNTNANNLSLLSSLIAAAMAPNFAIRTGPKSLRTSSDKTCAIHPSSVNSRRNEKAAEEKLDVAINEIVSSDQLYAFGEKSKTGGIGNNSGGQMFLRSTTMLDPLGYMLFGAFELEVAGNSLQCDRWLPIFGDLGALKDVERLKEVLDVSLLRVFEGLGVQIGQVRKDHATHPSSGRYLAARRDDHEDGDDEAEVDREAYDMDDPTLSETEVKDLDRLTSQVVRVLTMFTDARVAAQTSSRNVSRPDTPQNQQAGHRLASTANSRNGLTSQAGSRHETPRDSPYNSRPGSSLGQAPHSGGFDSLSRSSGAYVPPHAAGGTSRGGGRARSDGGADNWRRR